MVPIVLNYFGWSKHMAIPKRMFVVGVVEVVVMPEMELFWCSCLDAVPPAKVLQDRKNDKRWNNI